MCVFAKPQTLVHAGEQCLDLCQLRPWESTTGSTVGNPLRRWRASKPQAVVVMAANSQACRRRTKNLSAVPRVWTLLFCVSGGPAGTACPRSCQGDSAPGRSCLAGIPPGVFKGSQTLCFLTIWSQVLLNTHELSVGVSVRSQLQHCPLGSPMKTSLPQWRHALTQWDHYSAFMTLSD